jgi:hypothetical protein
MWLGIKNVIMANHMISLITKFNNGPHKIKSQCRTIYFWRLILHLPWNPAVDWYSLLLTILHLPWNHAVDWYSLLLTINSTSALDSCSCKEYQSTAGIEGRCRIVRSKEYQSTVGFQGRCRIVRSKEYHSTEGFQGRCRIVRSKEY